MVRLVLCGFLKTQDLQGNLSNTENLYVENHRRNSEPVILLERKKIKEHQMADTKGHKEEKKMREGLQRYLESLERYRMKWNETLFLYI